MGFTENWGWVLAADAALTLHALWVLTYVFGPFAGLKYRRWRVFQLSLMAATLVIWPAWGGCPLTTLENMMRRRAGEAVYPGGFVVFYLEKIVYWDIPRGHVALAAAAWIFLWAIAFIDLWRRKARE
jgi:hypothetical protein